jgi:ribonuclease Z
MFNKIQPRLAMVSHISYDEELIPEIVAGIRVHYSGLFQFCAPDIAVVNVTKDPV